MQHCGVPPGSPSTRLAVPSDPSIVRTAGMLNSGGRKMPSSISGCADGPESGPSVELGAARVADVVARVLVPQTCRREHVGDDRRLELCLVDLLEAAEPAVQRGLLSFRIEGATSGSRPSRCSAFLPSRRTERVVPSLPWATLPADFDTGRASSSLRARRRRRRRVQGYAQVLLGLGAQLLAEETWVLVLDRLHAGLAEELLASLVFIQSGIVVLERHPPSGPLRPRRDFVSRLSPATRYVS
eukprot:tig00021687_g23130.t1